MWFVCTVELHVTVNTNIQVNATESQQCTCFEMLDYVRPQYKYLKCYNGNNNVISCYMSLSTI